MKFGLVLLGRNYWLLLLTWIGGTLPRCILPAPHATIREQRLPVR
jgi:hypothetical protein